ncbi:MAG: DNA polymerase III subunit delta [Ignavibacteriales bacterium]|nr:DNA polymerase III subunit delta [Ignavibacteriales bacterium]
MAKSNLQPIKDLHKYLSKEKLLPIYFICGEDDYTIENSVEQIRKTVEPLVLSEFDKETITAEKGLNLTQVIDLALAFPFGGGKKLIVLKNFEKINDKKELVSYVQNPAEFTVLVVTSYGKVSDASREPYLLLNSKKFLFEVKNETGEELVEWLVTSSQKVGLNFSDDIARTVVEIVGEDKNLLDMQLQKFIDYALDKKNITIDEVRKLSSPTKQFTIFDLQDALGQGNKSKALEIAINLLDSGQEIVVILNMISKYILTIAQMTELLKSNINDNEAAKMIEVSWYYYVNCKKAKFFMSDERLLNATRALLNADLAVKTSAADSKTILVLLISEIMQ